MSKKKLKAKKGKDSSQLSVLSSQRRDADNGERTTDNHPESGFSYLPLNNFNVRAIILFVIGFAIYYNSFFNQTALDDEPVITKNEFVQNGLAGIPDIMSKDAYASFYESLGVKDQLSGGRYRPLSIITFAIEWEIFGDNPFVRHVVNVLLYLLSVILLLWLLDKYMLRAIPYGRDIAFMTALIFLVHPIHTEVIANTKSRDEIMSFLFIVLTFIWLFKYWDTKQIKALIWVGVFYFLAILSKEWGITLVLLGPAALYVFRKTTLREAFLSALPIFGVALLFMLIRSGIVAGFGKEEKELLNNPYLKANTEEKLATKIFVLLKYFKLQFFPHPLSADYAYNTIPYVKFGNWKVLTSVFVHLGMVAAMFYYLSKRHLIGFALLFYLGTLFLVSNLPFPLGATMGERLVYHSSFGFILAVSFLLIQVFRKIIPAKHTAAVILGLILVAITGFSAVKVIDRNKDWKNDITLFTHDVKVVPNSAMVNGNAGRSYIVLSDSSKVEAHKQLYLDTAIIYLRKAIQLHPKFVNAYFYIGSAYYRKNMVDSSEFYWNEARKYFPRHPEFKNQFDPILSHYYVKKAETTVKAGDLKTGAMYLEKALKYDPSDPEMWYNLGGISFSLGDYNRAYQAWNETIKLKPGHPGATQGLSAITVNPPAPK
jgi:protein O-mannosyl-transferase